MTLPNRNYAENGHTSAFDTRSVVPMDLTRDQVTLAIFFVGSVLAGGNAVGVRFSNRELDPLWGAGLRFSLAAIVLAAIMLQRRIAMPRGKGLTGAMVYGALTFGAGFALAYYGLQRVPAGIGQTLLAVVPLATLLLALVHHQERLRHSGVLGTLLAIVGIAIVTGAATPGSTPILSVLALLGSAACFAEATVIIHRFPAVNPIALNAVGMVTGAVFLLLAAAVTGSSFELPERAATWWAIAYLVFIGSVVVFVMYVVVAQRWEASRAAYAFVLIPIFTAIYSAWLDNERIGWGLVVGGALVLTGVYVGALRKPKMAARPTH